MEQSNTITQKTGAPKLFLYDDQGDEKVIIAMTMQALVLNKQGDLAKEFENKAKKLNTWAEIVALLPSYVEVVVVRRPEKKGLKKDSTQK